jgi:hypothetical protein
MVTGTVHNNLSTGRSTASTRDLTEEETEILKRHLEFLMKVENQLKDLDISNKEFDWLREAGARKKQQEESPTGKMKNTNDNFFPTIAASALSEAATSLSSFARHLPQVVEAKRVVSRTLERGKTSNASVLGLNSKIRKIANLVDSMNAFFGSYSKQR